MNKSDLKIGDAVAVLDEALEGHIVAIQDKLIVVECEGIPLQFEAHKLIQINSQLLKKELNNSNILGKKWSDFKPTQQGKKSSKRTKHVPSMEVDLHIDKLVKNYSRMDNYQILEIQLEEAQKQLNFALSKRIPKVILIHGVGAGVLKMELGRLLRSYENLNYRDADYAKYGLGATEVYFLQNAFR